MPYNLTWQEDNVAETGHRIYRSDAPMDINALPAPIGTVGPDVTEYLDKTAVAGGAYYYRVGAVIGASEVVSDEFFVQLGSPPSDIIAEYVPVFAPRNVQASVTA